MDLLYLVFSFLVSLFILLTSVDLYRKRRLPPGPIGLPIIGNLLDLGSKPHESLSKLAHKYGPFMTIRLGTITSVVASTPDAARQVLQLNDEACSSRRVPDVISAMKNPDAAVLWMPPHNTWRAIRKALNIYLTNRQKLDSLSDLRQNVVAGMVEFLQESGEKKASVDIGQLAFAVALNQLSNTIFSQNVTSYDSDNIAGFKSAVETCMEMLGKFNIADIFPVLKPLDPQNIRSQAKSAFNWLDEVIEGFVSERLKNRVLEVPTSGDMLDSLLDYSRENEAIFNLQHIKALLVDLFIAGTDTASNTITWAMTELFLNPDMLSRVREEVSQIVGDDRKIKEAKILDLPYLDAVIKETMRLHLAAPLLAPHKTETQVKLGNYIVPPNTQIFVNAWAMAQDPRYWKNPMVFMPERFLTNNVDYKGQHFEFIPFGSGRRRCPGMPLAHRMVRLIVASFVYHFDWELPHAREEMDMNCTFGLTLLKTIPLVATPIPLIG
ncbi:hypothetical protein L2E82_48384 [Cichorium intybus]|uniref:Uncharacterized protein n=1 Tax=Cichorium intybus TaxID=13427 RepID=A0ACB8YY48_CICIN|nr:hypothetical protein L2E82_48384 [Cichorium intybus]